MKDKTIEELLRYARGENQLKQSYLAFYDCDEDGTINIHSCKRIEGNRNHMVRFCDFSGKKIEPKISDEAVFKEIEKCMSNGKNE